MFQSSILSPKESGSGSAALSQPWYYYDQHGNLKYSFEVDLKGFPEESINVSFVNNTIIISAKLVEVDENNDERTHELRREVHLPVTVDASKAVHRLNANGILVVEADAIEPHSVPVLQRSFSPINTAQKKRVSTANYYSPHHRFVSSPPCLSPTFTRGTGIANNSDARLNTNQESFGLVQSPHKTPNQINNETYYSTKPSVTGRFSLAKPSSGRYYTTESILKSPTNQRSQKNVRLVAPSTKQSSTTRNLQTTWKQGLSVSPERGTQQNSHVPQRAVPDPYPISPCYPNKRYILRVDVGKHIQPKDLLVRLKNGVVIVSVKQFVEDKHPQSSTNRSGAVINKCLIEYTLPDNVNPTELTCRLQNGILVLETSFSAIGSFTSGLPFMLNVPNHSPHHGNPMQLPNTLQSPSYTHHRPREIGRTRVRRV